MNPKYICLICGFTDLDYAPFNELGSPSDTICPCCGYQFGYELLTPEITRIIELRNEWVSKNCPFFEIVKPVNWSFQAQLENVKLINFDTNNYKFRK